jgi:2-keto-3-deoxy-L-rhamnonate aldolase RhmA
MTKRILDVLRTPAGIMYPMIENAQQAKAAVESTRYPPRYPNGMEMESEDAHIPSSGRRSMERILIKHEHNDPP